MPSVASSAYSSPPSTINKPTRRISPDRSSYTSSDRSYNAPPAPISSLTPQIEKIRNSSRKSSSKIIFFLINFYLIYIFNLKKDILHDNLLATRHVIPPEILRDTLLVKNRVIQLLENLPDPLLFTWNLQQKLLRHVRQKQWLLHLQKLLQLLLPNSPRKKLLQIFLPRLQFLLLQHQKSPCHLQLRQRQKNSSDQKIFQEKCRSTIRSALF